MEAHRSQAEVTGRPRFARPTLRSCQPCRRSAKSSQSVSASPTSGPRMNPENELNSERGDSRRWVVFPGYRRLRRGSAARRLQDPGRGSTIAAIGQKVQEECPHPIQVHRRGQLRSRYHRPGPGQSTGADPVEVTHSHQSVRSGPFRPLLIFECASNQPQPTGS
jgi:hypothetical protein